MIPHGCVYENAFPPQAARSASRLKLGGSVDGRAPGQSCPPVKFVESEKHKN